MTAYQVGNESNYSAMNDDDSIATFETSQLDSARVSETDTMHRSSLVPTAVASDINQSFFYHLKPQFYSEKLHINGERGWYLSVSSRGFVKCSGKKSSRSNVWRVYKLMTASERRERDEVNQAVYESLQLARNQATLSLCSPDPQSSMPSHETDYLSFSSATMPEVATQQEARTHVHKQNFDSVGPKKALPEEPLNKTCLPSPSADCMPKSFCPTIPTLKPTVKFDWDAIAAHIERFENFPGFNAGRDLLMAYFETDEGRSFLRQPPLRSSLALYHENKKLGTLLNRLVLYNNNLTAKNTIE